MLELLAHITEKPSQDAASIIGQALAFLNSADKPIRNEAINLISQHADWGDACVEQTHIVFHDGAA